MTVPRPRSVVPGPPRAEPAAVGSPVDHRGSGPGAAFGLALAARFALRGAASWARTGLVALGVGVGVAVLLLAASVPTALDAREARAGARLDVVPGGEPPAPGPGVLRIAEVDSSLGGVEVRGRLLAPEGPGAPVPPGLAALPADGDMAVSPALRDLLATPDGDLLRARLPYRDAATITDAGLLGPQELAFYATDDRVRSTGAGALVDSFGQPVTRPPLDPVLRLVAGVGVVALLLPVAVFVSTAARFGAARRDRRLAALRLLGLDAGRIRRLAAAEALWAALLGDLVGVGVFAAGRQLLRWASVPGLSFFPADARPQPVLALAVLLAVPAVAVVAGAVGLRAVAAQPLAVVRSAARGRRRVWWRLLLPVAGLALLVQQLGTGAEVRLVALAAGLVLVGVLALLPWAVDVVVRRLGAGPVPWQLAVRRLQAGSGTSGRVAAGVAVAVAGLLALQGLLTGLSDRYQVSTGDDPARADLLVRSTAVQTAEVALARGQRLAAAPGVTSVRTLARTWLLADGAAAGGEQPLLVGECPALAEVAEVGDCRDGDSFVVDGEGQPALAGRSVTAGAAAGGQAAGDAQGTVRWVVPDDAVDVVGRTDATGFATGPAVLATPAAVELPALDVGGVTTYVTTSSTAEPVLAGVVGAAVDDDPAATVRELVAERAANPYRALERGLWAGALAVLATIGASMLLTSTEQVRERRPVLAALAALGVRRRTLAASLLLGDLVPVVLGAVLAVGAGAGLGALLLVLVGAPPVLDPVAAVGTATVAGAVVLAVGALGQVALRRATSPDGLRSE